MRFHNLSVLLLCASGVAQVHAGSSLYSPSTYQPLTSDFRQRHVGDLITVMVYETSSATSTANTSTGRDASVGFGIGGTHKDLAGSFKTNNQLDGGGSTGREGKVLAQITVGITEITAHGDLMIAGEQLLEVNNEKQQIRVEGRIRQQDVSDANVVLSTRVANAKITYAGQGDLANTQRPSWWQRFATMFGL